MAYIPEQVLRLPSRLSSYKEPPQLSTSLASSSSSSQQFGEHFLTCRAPLRLSASRGVEVKAHLRPVEDQAGLCSDRSPFSRSNLSSSSPRHRHLMAHVQAAKKTYSSFDDLLKNSETAVLVDFYATWCGPCQFMVPVLDDVGRSLKDRVRVVKIDSEKYPSIASRYGVQALPTLILFQNGQPIDRLEGAMTAPELIKRIEGVLSSLKVKARD